MQKYSWLVDKVATDTISREQTVIWYTRRNHSLEKRHFVKWFNFSVLFRGWCHLTILLPPASVHRSISNCIIVSKNARVLLAQVSKVVWIYFVCIYVVNVNKCVCIVYPVQIHKNVKTANPLHICWDVLYTMRMSGRQHFDLTNYKATVSHTRISVIFVSVVSWLILVNTKQNIPFGVCVLFRENMISTNKYLCTKLCLLTITLILKYTQSCLIHICNICIHTMALSHEVNLMEWSNGITCWGMWIKNDL